MKSEPLSRTVGYGENDALRFIDDRTTLAGHFQHADEVLDRDPRPEAHQVKRAEMAAEGDDSSWENAIRQLEDS